MYVHMLKAQSLETGCTVSLGNKYVPLSLIYSFQCLFMIHDIFLCFRMIDFCLSVAFMVRLNDDFLLEVLQVEIFLAARGSHMATAGTIFKLLPT